MGQRRVNLTLDHVRGIGQEGLGKQEVENSTIIRGQRQMFLSKIRLDADQSLQFRQQIVIAAQSVSTRATQAFQKDRGLRFYLPTFEPDRHKRPALVKVEDLIMYQETGNP